MQSAYMSLILYDLPGLYGLRLTRIVDKSRCRANYSLNYLLLLYRMTRQLVNTNFICSGLPNAPPAQYTGAAFYSPYNPWRDKHR